MSTPEPPPEAMYRLPVGITESDSTGDLGVLHATLVSRLRSEHLTDGTPSTLTELLIERTATNYVAIKAGEGAKVLGDPRVHKEVNALFLGIIAQLERVAPRDPQQAAKVMAQGVIEAVEDVCDGLDPEVAGQLKNALAAKFEEAGIL